MQCNAMKCECSGENARGYFNECSKFFNSDYERKHFCRTCKCLLMCECTVGQITVSEDEE